MELCNNDHDEIVYEKGSKYDGCPLCEAVQEIETLQDQVDELVEEMETHECKPEPKK